MFIVKKLSFLLLFFISVTINAQIPVEFSIQARGSDIVGVIGAELQVDNFSINYSCRPLVRDVNSYVTTLSMYFKYNQFFESQPYASIGYATKGYPYSDNLTHYYEPMNLKFSPAIFILGGFRTKLNDVTPGLSAKTGIGMTLSEQGECFSFEVGLNYVLFKSFLND